MTIKKAVLIYHKYRLNIDEVSYLGLSVSLPGNITPAQTTLKDIRKAGETRGK